LVQALLRRTQTGQSSLTTQAGKGGNVMAALRPAHMAYKVAVAQQSMAAWWLLEAQAFWKSSDA